MSTTTTLTSLQQRINAWCQETFPEQTPETILAHLREEVVELKERGTAEEAADCLILLLAWSAQSNVPLLAEDSRAALLARLRHIADDLHFLEVNGLPARSAALFFLATLAAWAAMSDVDLLAAAEAKHAVNLTRRWQRGADGIHRHVPAEVHE
jgi:hypothetical protein